MSKRAGTPAQDYLAQLEHDRLRSPEKKLGQRAASRDQALASPVDGGGDDDDFEHIGGEDAEEDADGSFEGLENVRACCGGAHDLTSASLQRPLPPSCCTSADLFACTPPALAGRQRHHHHTHPQQHQRSTTSLSSHSASTNGRARNSSSHARSSTSHSKRAPTPTALSPTTAFQNQQVDEPERSASPSAWSFRSRASRRSTVSHGSSSAHAGGGGSIFGRGKAKAKDVEEFGGMPPPPLPTKR